MGIRGVVGYGISALLGAVFVVLPAEAGSETTPAPKIVAENTEYLGKPAHYWTPRTSPQAEVQPGGSVEFSNPTEVPHGVEWVSTPGGAPSCDAGVKVGTTAADSGTKWSGTCSFANAGTYIFYCTVHHSEMTGEIVVAGSATGPGTTTGTGTTTTITGTTPPQGETQTGASGPPAHPLTALSALRLTAPRHGASIRGSLRVPAGSAGGRLEVDLLATSRSLNVAHGASAVIIRVGRLLRTHVPAGEIRFTIPASARARAALRAHGSLALTLRVTLTPPAGAAASLRRRLTLRR
jgi:plastocyanin